MKRKEDEPGKGLARAALARGARVLLSLVPLLGAGCGRSTRAAPPSPVVVISVDTLRADHLPVYGYRGVQTPSIDAIARDSTIFDNAYSNVPLTLPSHAALLTGLLPFENGVRDNIGFRLAPERQSLASLLRAASYATGAAVSSYVLRADRGLAAGFDSYDDSMPETPTRERPGLESAAALAKWAENVRGRPLFLFLHIYEPHTPYKPPEPFASRYASAPYDGEIAAADAAVGSFVEFLKRAGLYDRAILVFLSDHGEGLGDHGEEEHGVFLYREALRVPLLLKRPGSAGAGKRISAPVSLTDIVPTVLSLLSLPVPSGLHGAVLTSLPAGGPAADRRIYSETLYPRLGLGWSDLASLADARYHYIHAPRPELYDLAADPGERKDLAPGLPAPFRSLRTALETMSRPFSMPGGLLARGAQEAGGAGLHQRLAGSARRRPPSRSEGQGAGSRGAQESLRAVLRGPLLRGDRAGTRPRRPGAPGSLRVEHPLGLSRPHGQGLTGDRSPAQRHRRRAAGDLLGRAARAGVREPLDARGASGRRGRTRANAPGGGRARAGLRARQARSRPAVRRVEGATPRRWRCSRPVRP